MAVAFSFPAMEWLITNLFYKFVIPFEEEGTSSFTFEDTLVADLVGIAFPYFNVFQTFVRIVVMLFDTFVYKSTSAFGSAELFRSCDSYCLLHFFQFTFKSTMMGILQIYDESK